jgi:RHS repeat-associated protein
VLVAALVNAADGTVVANYEYGPFGELIRATGPMAKANPIRFSTKYQDNESDLVYYGYRYYDRSTGKWLNRDPLSERGFTSINKSKIDKSLFMSRVVALIEFLWVNRPTLVESVRTRLMEDSRGLLQLTPLEGNLYAFVANTPIDKQDSNGLSPSSGFTCDKGLLTAARILCYCPYARSATVAGVCNGCWNGCNRYCIEQYLDGTMTEKQMKSCVLDCDKRELKCIRSGCDLKFN